MNTLQRYFTNSARAAPRLRICKELEWFGLVLHPERNQEITDCEGRVSTDESRLHAYVIPVEEGLLIAQEAIRTVSNK
ncbi:hypothetical protein [Iningainema tapete]|uniref:Uncharacterized protein n=1 Tax=Iningainema tapete BLCC-T55 TaxID=2748662 RepID=A0A8J7BYH5_9CYAN|nr:hypothetical protein [Iningainema tapete]MBD2775742.1 hypothetical protein [Iningainema tapete BLCC-T55]